MSEITLDLRREPKDRAYAYASTYLFGLLAGMDDIAGMATISSLIP